jgi:hypothetical protein
VEGLTGGVIEAESKDVADANVTRIGVGTYCFDNLPFVPKNVVASPRARKNVWVSASVGGNLDCEADDDAVIKTGDPGSATTVDHNFSAVFN